MRGKQQQILEAALELAPFDGWNPQTLVNATKNAGLEPEYAEIAFPEGAKELVDFFIRSLDTKMLEKMHQHNTEKLKVRERITLAIRFRIEASAPYKQALRKAIAFYASPLNICHAAPSLWKTVDEIWYAAGDKSADFNFYTKRATLAGVYSSTLLYWLSDKSKNQQDTWKFLDKRINNVMQFNKIKAKFF